MPSCELPETLQQSLTRLFTLESSCSDSMTSRTAVAASMLTDFLKGVEVRISRPKVAITPRDRQRLDRTPLPIGFP